MIIVEKMKKRIEEIEQEIKKYSPYPEKVRIVAATKYTDAAGVENVVNAGVLDVGENRVQSMMEKIEKINNDKIKWNFIGHLQKNKVKYIIDSVYLIHSVDSIELALEIDKRAKKINKVINILLELNIAGEESKNGYSEQKIFEEAKEYLKFENLNVIGLMGMAPNTDDKEVLHKVFSRIREIKDRLNAEIFNGNLSELSMGMSNDYIIALEEGATLIRIGSKLFK